MDITLKRQKYLSAVMVFIIEKNIILQMENVYMLKRLKMKKYMSSGGHTIGTVNLDMQMIVKDFFSGLMKEVCHASRRINKGGGIKC